MVGSASIDALGNRLRGNSGNHALADLDGGAGADVMAGGTGSDAYVVDSLDDIVLEQAGQGNDTVYTELSYTLGANVENLQLIGAVDGSGNELNNVIIGNSSYLNAFNWV